ncbi:MAG: HAMP domain-containing protein [Myxococcales bacterium]|nr:HAMP domain-containing protein [Myxococcales bacterium]
MFGKFTLTKKLLSLFLGFGLIPMLAIGAIAFQASESIADRAGDRLESVAVGVADKVDRSLFERYGDVQAFAANRTLLETKDWYRKGDDNPIVRTMNTLVATYGIYYLMILVDTDGRVIAVSSKDADGRTVDTGSLWNKSYKEAPWFKAVAAGQFTTKMAHTAPGNDKSTGTFIEDAHVDPDVKTVFGGDPALTLGFSAPVRDATGKVVAYWSNRARFSVVEEMFRSTYAELKSRGYPSAELNLLDEKGNLIIDYDPSASGGDEVKHDFNTLFKFNLAEKVESAKRAVAGESGHEVAFHVRKKTDTLNGFTHLRGALGYPGMNWSVLVRIPAAEGLAEVSSIRRQVIGAGLVGALLIVALGFWVVRRLVRPIVAMKEAAGRIALGDIDQRIDHEASDEIGDLSSALRGLVEFIRATAQAADAVARGDLSREVTARSDKDVLSQSFQRASAAQRRLVTEATKLIDAARSGHLEQRGDTAGMEGVYLELVQGMNQMLAAVAAPLDEAGSVLCRVAERDLTARVEGRYDGAYAEIASSLNKAAGDLESALSQVSVASSQVTTASAEITSGSQSLANSTTEQAASLEEVTASLQEITGRAKDSSDRAREAQTMVGQAGKSAERGVQSMTQMSSAIERIKVSADETAKIVKTIDEIAFQTNLLALNAAVEAARAGDAGRGFAVVAEEVRGLAMRSAEAAKSTAKLIGESVQNATEGVALNEVVTRNFDEIAEQVKVVHEVVGKIASSAEQQAVGVQQINAAVDQMSQMTQQNAATSEESASAAEELSAQARALGDMVGGFRIAGHTGAAPASGPRTAPHVPPPLPAQRSAPRKLHAVSKGSNGHAKGAALIPFDDDDAVLAGF